MVKNPLYSLFLPPYSIGVYFLRSDPIHLRVDPISKSYFFQRNKHEYIQANITLFSKRKQGAFIRAGVVIRIDMVCCALFRLRFSNISLDAQQMLVRGCLK